MSYNNLAVTFTNKFDLIQYCYDNFVVTKKGSRHFIQCPFHGENTPSCLIEKERYYCFGCHAHGSSIDFLKDYLGVSFLDVVQDISLVKQYTGNRKSKPRNNNQDYYVYPSMSIVMNYHVNLSRHKNKIGYLKSRFVNGKTIKAAVIGYGNPIDFQYFHLPRYTIPVFGDKGELISIRYRVDPEFDDGSEPKYLAHPRTPTTLYNLSVLSNNKHIIYVGSQLDAAFLYNRYNIAAVAPPGESVFKDEWKEKFTNKNVLIWLDKDTTGYESSLRIYTALSEVCDDIHLFHWPHKYSRKSDIGDFVKIDGIESVTKICGKYGMSFES